MRVWKILFVLMLTGVCGAAMASPPPAVDPGQVIQRFDVPEQASPPLLPYVVPDEAPADDASGGPRFVLQDVALADTTVYGAEDIARMTKDMRGQDVSLSDLQRLRDRLTVRYRRDGYLLSRVILPPQRVRDGAVRLEAVEGYVSRIVLEDPENDPKIAAILSRIENDRPLRAATLERSLLLVNDLHGVRAEAIFRPAPSGRGASELHIKIMRTRFDGYASLDNRGSRYLGPLQAIAMAGANGLLHDAGRTVVRGAISIPPDELRYADIEHTVYAGSDGLIFSGRLAWSDTDPGGRINNLGIKGDSALYEVRALYPVVRARRKNLDLYAQARILNTNSDIMGAPDAYDRLRAVALGFRFDASDRLNGSNKLEAQWRKGVDIFGATEDGIGRSRANGAHDFDSFYFSAQRVQNFSRGVSASMSFAGQYARDALLSSEEFSLGGGLFGRGYDAAEITGDHGAAFGVELRRDFVPRAESVVRAYQIYGFYDAGVVWNRNRVVLESARESLASAGVGVRFDLDHNVDAGAELAVPLTRGVESMSNHRPVRAFFRLGKRF